MCCTHINILFENISMLCSSIFSKLQELRQYKNSCHNVLVMFAFNSPFLEKVKLCFSRYFPLKIKLLLVLTSFILYAIKSKWGSHNGDKLLELPYHFLNYQVLNMHCVCIPYLLPLQILAFCDAHSLSIVI